MNKSAKVLFAIVGGVVLLLLLFSALPGVIMRDMSMMGGMGSMMSGDMMGGVIGILFMLLFWGLVVALLVALVVLVVKEIQRR